MKSIKTANIMLVALLVIGAAILAYNLFSTETVGTTPVKKSMFGISLSGKPTTPPVAPPVTPPVTA